MYLLQLAAVLPSRATVAAHSNTNVGQGTSKPWPSERIMLKQQSDGKQGSASLGAQALALHSEAIVIN
jgi:hypothetical protein